jgi:D-lactate dehydrogenase (cytochrome)
MATTASGLRDELLELVPDPTRVSDGESVRALHGEDLSHHARHLPDVVVFAAVTDEVSRVLAYASQRRIPVVPFGAGTSLEGHVIPVQGGISLDLSRLDRIVAVQPEDLTAVVEPGVLREQLNERLARDGLQFPVDPGANASLGGMAATNASGTTSVRYGGMRRQVLGLQVVLADGSVIRTGGRVAKSSAGYDLTSLFVGSEGTLGVITELTLRVYGIPEHVVAARAVFPDVTAACQTAAALVATGVLVTRCELVDEHTVHAVNAFSGTQYEEAPTLFLEFAGSRAAVEGDIEAARELAELGGCRSIEFETEVEQRNRLWEARHNAAFAIAALAPGKRKKPTDVAVPVSQLPEAIRRTREALERRGMTAAILGHVADGNYHVSFMVDPDDPDDVARAMAVDEEQVEFALELGGTCTGEHGVGLGKRKHLEAEHGDLLPLMRGIKGVLDPNGILNPGKVV